MQSHQQQTAQGIEERFRSLERSLKRWKRFSVAAGALFSCAFLMAADDPAVDHPGVTRFGTIEANAVSAKNFFLTDGENGLGQFSVQTLPDGRTVPILSVEKDTNRFYVAIEPDKTIMGFDCNEKPVFDVRASKRSTMLQVSQPNGALGVMLTATADKGSDVSIQANNKLTSVLSSMSKP